MHSSEEELEPIDLEEKVCDQIKSLNSLTTEEITDRLASRDLSCLTLMSLDFFLINLDGVNFENSNLINVNFSRAKLTKANLTGANLENAMFQGACLVDACLLNANLKGAKIQAAHLEKANLGVQTYHMLSSLVQIYLRLISRARSFLTLILSIQICKKLT